MEHELASDLPPGRNTPEPGSYGWRKLPHEPVACLCSSVRPVQCHTRFSPGSLVCRKFPKRLNAMVYRRKVGPGDPGRTLRRRECRSSFSIVPPTRIGRRRERPEWRPSLEGSSRPPQPEKEIEDRRECQSSKSGPAETVASCELPSLCGMPRIAFNLQLLRFARWLYAPDVFELPGFRAIDEFRQFSG